MKIINSYTLDEFVEKYGYDYTWESTLEEDIAESNFEMISESTATKQYSIGDILFIWDKNRKNHRIVITNTNNNGRYEGYLLSSQIQKANINDPKYPNNIFIEHYNTILKIDNGIDKPAFIRVDDLVRFKQSQLSSGCYKGTVKPEFLKFLNQCIDNYKNGIDNSKMIWK